MAPEPESESEYFHGDMRELEGSGKRECLFGPFFCSAERNYKYEMYKCTPVVGVGHEEEEEEEDEEEEEEDEEQQSLPTSCEWVAIEDEDDEEEFSHTVVKMKGLGDWLYVIMGVNVAVSVFFFTF